MTQTTWIIAEIFMGIALLTILTALVARWFGPPGQRDPVQILRERYARGELSRAEYQQMATDLGIDLHSVSDRQQTTSRQESGPTSASGHAS